MKNAILILSLLFIKMVVALPETSYFSIGKNSFCAVEVSPAKISLHWKDDENKPYHYFAELKSDLEKKGKTVIILMNAGIYTTKNQPAGLHVESGKK